MNDGPPTPPPEPVREPLSLGNHGTIRANGSAHTSRATSASPTRTNGRGLKSRGLRSNSGESRNGAAKTQQKQPEVIEAAVSVAKPPPSLPPGHATKRSQDPDGQATPQPGGGAPQGKMMRASVPASRPGAVSVTEPSAASEPGAGVGGAPQGKTRRTTAPSRPGAVGVVEPRPGAMSVVEPTTTGGRGVGGAPQGKMRASVPVASRPGAMSVVAPAEPGASTGVGGAPQGKMRRTTAAAEVRPGATSVVEPSATEPSQFHSSFSSFNGGAVAGMDNSFSSLNESSSHLQSRGPGLRASNHRRGLRKGTDGEANEKPSGEVSTEAEADPQSIRRKQIQEIMKDTSLNQQEKQAKIQQLMAGGMPKAPTPTSEAPKVTPEAAGAGDDPQTIRRKQIQEITKDTSLSQQEKQAKIQQLMAGGMPRAPPPKTSEAKAPPVVSEAQAPQVTPEAADPGDDPQTIRRKQIQEIMKDSTLTQPEKQAKIQQLMASGMPKAGSPSVASTHDMSDSSTEPNNVPNEIAGPPADAEDDVEDLAEQEVAEQELAKQEDEEARRQNQEIMEIMMDPTLTAREKQIKTQEVLANGILNLSSQHGSDRKADQSRSVSPSPQRKRGPRGLGVTRNRTFDSNASGRSARSAGLRRAHTSDTARRSSHSPSRGLRRNTASGSSHSPHRGSAHSTGRGLRKSVGSGSAHSTGRGLRKSAGSGSAHSTNSSGIRRITEQELLLGEGSNHSEVSMDSFHDDDSDGVEMHEDGSENGAYDEVAREPVGVDSAPDVQKFATPAGVGGAPQGKMRRTTGAASTPGAVSVAGTSNEPSTVATGVGGAPQGKMRRTAAAAAKPGAVSVVEPAAASSEPGAVSGVGGAPQGKMRRTTAAAAKPGAVSVVEPAAASSEPGAVSGVGGAPQGKTRRTTAAAAKPGAVSVAPGPSEPGASAGTGVGGAPQGKFRGTARPSAPGAVSVVEPNVPLSEPGTAASTGVGGAPQGKFKRSVNSHAATAGDVETAAPPAMLARAKTDGAAQVSMPPVMLARAQTEASREPNMALSKPGAMAGVGGAPQGKFRRSEMAPVVPGAVSVEEPTAPATAQTSTAGESMASKMEKDMLAKSSVRRSRPAHVRPGAQVVENVSPTEPDGSQVPSTASSLPPVREDENADFNHAVKLVEDDLAIKMRAKAEAQGATTVRSVAAPVPSPPSQSSFKGNADDDFNHAVKLVEDDLQIKMRIRAEAQMGTAAGASQDNYSHDTVSGHYDDLEMQKEKEKEVVRAEPASMQSRMNQKILQMEAEHRARDEKLDELDRIDSRARISQRFKDPSGPMSDIFNDESEPIENGFLHPDPEAIRRAEEDGLAIAIAVDEEDEPDVYEVELKMYDPESKPPFHQNRRFRCYAVFICLLTTAAVIMVGVLTAKNAGEVIYITDAPSASPSMAPTTTRETAVRGELARVIGDKVNEPGTPYDKAMDWILYEDPMNLDEFDENLIQRYILALFYYQTSDGGEQPWISCNPPNLDAGENYTCPFYDFYRPENTIEAPTWVLRNETAVRWLSEKHECQWAEVLCHPEHNGNVIGLDIRGQNLTGTLPDELRHLEDLMWLSLSQNLFKGTIPSVYGEFPYLTIFEVVETDLTGEIPSGFFRQSNLLQFNPAFTLLSGTIPPEIGDLTALHSLFWFNTLITGTLPTEMGLMEDIRNIWMWDNLLTGPIPSEVGQLSLLEDLKLANNGHTGPLPSELGLLTNMEELLISNSNLHGTTIPEELWNMTNTIFLDFNNAGLGGTISTKIGQMTNLKGLKASRNKFTGTIPSEIGLCDDLLLLWFHMNEGLGGEVPIEICYLSGPENLQFLNADCRGNPPRIDCICCTGCCDEWGQCQSQ